jgi:outer membrane protein assembly factor BamB
MKNIFFKKLFYVFFLFSFFTVPLFTINITQGHRGKITALANTGKNIISAGEDGFIVIWETGQRAAVERFQLTTDRIEALAIHPSREEICITETDGIGIYRISVWNYTLKEKKFSVNSIDPVTYINYSAGGSFIIAAGFNGSFLALFNSETGELVSIPEIPQGSVTLAATGRAEQIMLLYQGEYKDYLDESTLEYSQHEGQILYLELESGSVTGRFHAPGNMPNPLLFGNNRFLAGINSRGLLLVNAVTGEIFDSAENIERDALLCASDEGFYCLSRRNNTSVLYHYTVNRNGKLVISKQFSLPFDTANQINQLAYNGNVIFASAQGSLLLFGEQNRIIPMTTEKQTRITEIAAGEKTAALLTENGDLFFLPLDYSLLKNNDKFIIKNNSSFSRITSIPSLSEKSAEQFLLWQTANTRFPPQIVYSNHRIDELNLNFMVGRFPLRSISAGYGNILVLDWTGVLSVYNLEKLPAKADFSYTSPGANDAVFINNQYLVLSRSTANNNSPYLFINYKTGETIRVPYNTQAGITVYAGNSGNIYAESIEQEGNKIKTVILGLSLTRVPVRIFEYQGEAINLSIAESSKTPAIACDNEGALIMGEKIISFERTPGLPVKLLGCGKFFISLDSEGNVSWHDNKNGKILAVFSLYSPRWKITRKTDNTEISGELLYQ